MTNPTPPRLQRAEPFIVAAIVATVYFMQSLSSVMQVGAFNDDGVYAVLGKAIAEGKGYLSIHLVGAPVHPKFPPVFPLILALFWKITGSIEGVQRMVSFVHPIVIGVSAALLWWVGRERYKIAPALLVLLVITMLFFDSAIQYYTIPLSEPWFILGSSITIFCWARAERAGTDDRLRWIVSAALAAAMTVLVRSQGVALLPALAFALSRRDFRMKERIVAGTVAIVPLAIWYSYHAALIARGPHSNLPDDITYDTWMRLGLTLRSVMGTVASNVVWYAEQFGSYFATAQSVGTVIACVVFAAMVAGACIVAKRAPLVSIPVLVGFLLVVLWPFAQDRLLLSILPFAGLSLAIASRPIVERFAGQSARIMNFAAASLVIAFMMTQSTIRSTNIKAFASGTFPPTYSPGFMLLVNSRFIAQASAWVRANTARDARVMVDNHPGIYLYTGRETMPANPSESRMQRSVFEKPGRYLASHILSDSLTNLIVGTESDGIMRDVAAIKSSCPQVLTWGGVSRDDPQSIMRVRSDPDCLEKLSQ
jgi:hypothetical protein